MLQYMIPIMLLVFSSLSVASENVVLDTFTRDWDQVRVQAQDRQLPVLIVVTSEDCGYCERLKQEVLRPMQRDGEPQIRAIVREMDIWTGGKVVDFDGEKVRARIFLSRYQIFATPTLLFLDHNGRPLHDPLVGFNGIELYWPLLESALNESTAALEQIVGNDTPKLANQSPLLDLDEYLLPRPLKPAAQIPQGKAH